MEGELFSDGADEPSSRDLFISMKERNSTNAEQSLRKQLGLKKSLQILEHSASPGYRSASPLIKEAGTPKPFLPRSTSKEHQYNSRMEASSPFQFQTSFNESSRSPYNQSNASLLQVSFSAADKTNNTTNLSLLIENDPAIEGCGSLFTEFMTLYCNHPHSSDVFELIEQYEEACRTNIKSLVEYINKTDPSRRRSKKTLHLLNQLYQECYTWRLLGSLYRDRILSETMGNDMEMEEVTYFDSAKSEKVIMERLFDCEAGTRHCQIIVDWLEKNTHDKLEDLLMTENIEYHSQSTYWEHTAHDLHQLKARSRDPALASNLVREIDPDAPIRQGRNLSSLDQQDEEQLLLCMFRFIRAGKLEKAQKLCSERGHFWRAATLDGWRLWHDPNYFANEMDDEIQTAEGNPDRDLWKINCWSMAEEKCLGTQEKAIYAALSGHLDQMLPACNSWEDCLWAHFKVLVDVRVEQEIRNHPRSSRDFLPLPKQYWEQVHSNNLTPQGVIDQLKAHPRLEIQKQCKETYRLFQTNIIMNEIDELLLEMKMRVKEQNNPHLLRFMAHLVLFLQAVGIQTNETICVEVLQSYVQVLIDNKQNNLVAIYTARLPPEMQVTIYAQFLEGIDDDTRETYLELGEEAGLELKQITKRIVENIRDKDCTTDGPDENDTRKINSVDWLIFDPAQRAEAVKQANAIMRGFLAERKHEAAHSVFDKLPNDTIDVIHKQWRMRAGEKMLPADIDDAIREYLCIRAYLNAHDSFNAWFQHYHNQGPVEPKQRSHQTFKEQIAFDESVKEYQMEFQRWQKTLASHVKATSDCIYNVLLFPGGWMLDQRQDSTVDATRSQQLFLLRQLCIPYLTFLLHSVLQSNHLYKPCLKLAEIIQSKRYKLYETFQKHELQKFLGLIRDTSIALLDQGVDPFGFERNNSSEAN